MIKKVITALILIASLSFYAFTIYENIPKSPIYLDEDEIMPDEIAMINYGLTPVFANNLRFNHNNISYSIHPDCNQKRKNAMLNAFDIFEKEMKLISFYEDSLNADINIGCSDVQINMGDNLFAAGEGGPSKIINTSVFKTIEQGRISLYDDPRCDYPIVELHELLHVFGFDHTANKASIMYNISKCNQRITSDMVTIINDLYSIEPLADASISELIAVKKGKYLDFNITVLNEGLMPIEDINLTILADNKIVQTIGMKKIEIGYGRTLEAKNVILPSLNTKTITFEVDYEDSVRELNKANNIREMSVPPQ